MRHGRAWQGRSSPSGCPSFNTLPGQALTFLRRCPSCAVRQRQERQQDTSERGVEQGLVRSHECRPLFTLFTCELYGAQPFMSAGPSSPAGQRSALTQGTATTPSSPSLLPQRPHPPLVPSLPHLPGSCFAIVAHLLPMFLCIARMTRSSSSLKGPFFTDGFSWFSHL